MFTEFLETYPLYRKFHTEHLTTYTNNLPVAKINMRCSKCGGVRTFEMKNRYAEFTQQLNYPVSGLVSRWFYLCGDCQIFTRIFVVKFSENIDWVMKIGQLPSWEITGNKDLEKRLGEYSDLYQKGLICESQGYGIGAFGYYRRIVEETIGDLLNEITDLVSPAELSEYQIALEKTKATVVTQEKIELVKDLLPAILRPDNINPLQVLHSSLSEGLHAGSDEACLEHSESIRSTLIFLVSQIAVTKDSSKEFTQNMRKLLDKKSGKTS